MTDRTYAALTRHAIEQVRQHRSVILDATFSSRLRRDALRKALKRAGVGYCFVEIRAEIATVKRRLAGRAHSGGEISDARLEDLTVLDDAYEPPEELDAPHFFQVKTARNPEAVVATILKILAQRRARSAGPP
jgi:predicted kinase